MWGLIVAGVLAAGGPEATARTLAGERVSGALVELAAESVILEVDGQRRVLDTKDLIELVPAKPAAAGKASVWIELTDRSTLAASDYRAAGGQAQVTLADGGSAEVPAAAVSIVRLKEQ